MISARWRGIFAPVFLGLLLTVSACAPEAPSRYDQVQRETLEKGADPAVAKNATQGSSFNKFFPKSGGGYKVIPSQEKKGFAEYKLNQGNKTVAVLSVSDTTSVPTAAAKYQQSTYKVGGYPAVDQGANGTGVLVGPYQVKVQSRDTSFTRDDRIAWIKKFNLNGLANLK